MEQNIPINFNSEVFLCQLTHRETPSSLPETPFYSHPKGEDRARRHSEQGGANESHPCNRVIPMALIKHIVEG